MRNDFCSDYLEHSAKGTTWTNTKYLKKIPLGNGQYYYIYTQAELDAYNKRNQTNSARNVLSNEQRDANKNATLQNTQPIDNMLRNGMMAKGNTTAEKTANLQNDISNGQKQIDNMLSNDSSTKNSKKSGSSGKSGSSKSKSGSSSKGSSGKEKSSSGKDSSSSKKSNKETKKDNSPLTMDSLKKMFNKKDKDVTKHEKSISEFKRDMLSKYKEGSFGYMSSGNKIYKWSIEGGQLILKDANGKEVSADKYLKDAKKFEEFESNIYKKK